MKSIEQLKIEECIKLIKNGSILVLATTGDMTPHTSLMAYVPADDGLEIYMLSSSSSQKWTNIVKNPHVGILIDDRDCKLTEQRAAIKALSITGTHHEVTDKEQLESIKKLFSEKNPDIAKAFSGPDCKIIRIRVNSFKLLNGPTDSFYTENI